jgi:hypothetical protein
MASAACVIHLCPQQPADRTHRWKSMTAPAQGATPTDFRDDKASLENPAEEREWREARSSRTIA